MSAGVHLDAVCCRLDQCMLSQFRSVQFDCERDQGVGLFWRAHLYAMREVRHASTMELGREAALLMPTLEWEGLVCLSVPSKLRSLRFGAGLAMQRERKTFYSFKFINFVFTIGISESV